MVFSWNEQPACAWIHLATLGSLDSVGHVLQDMLLGGLVVIHHPTALPPQTTPVAHLDEIHRDSSHRVKSRGCIHWLSHAMRCGLMLARVLAALLVWSGGMHVRLWRHSHDQLTLILSPKPTLWLRYLAEHRAELLHVHNAASSVRLHRPRRDRFWTDSAPLQTLHRYCRYGRNCEGLANAGITGRRGEDWLIRLGVVRDLVSVVWFGAGFAGLVRCGSCDAQVRGFRQWHDFREATDRQRARSASSTEGAI